MARQYRTGGNRRSGSTKLLPRERASSSLVTTRDGQETRDVAVRRILRPYATAGVVIVAAGLMVATPGVLPLPDFQMHDVSLTTDGSSLPDLLTPWIDQYNAAAENASTLMNNFFLAPGVGLQQMIANLSGYLQNFFDDPSSSIVADANSQIQGNLASVLTAYGLQNADAATTATVLEHTLDGSTDALSGNPAHALMFSEIPGYLPASDAAALTPIINFLASPASGIIMGGLGPFISPWIALMNSIDDHDGLSDTLSNVVGSFFNGADLDLDSLLPTINGLIGSQFPPGMTLEHLDIGFGGLLSTGSVTAGPYEVGGAEIPAVGGSIFNSVGLDFSGVPVLGNLDMPSQPIGPLGAWEGWAQTIAALLGWNGDESPLTGVDLPTIPADFFEADAGTAAAGDMSTWLQDLIASL